jgi:protein-S-isoprenylcysteine O-methyltransferase Ste14
MIARVAFAFALEFAVFAVLLFGAAGTVAWGAAWASLVVFFVGGGWVTVLLMKRDPALLAERLRPPLQREQPFWDKVFVVAIGVLWCAWLVLMGFDAGRFHWSVMPVWLQGVGAALLACAFWLAARVFLENTFLAPVVKIQRERGHTVITTGPYAVVRHPLYAAALVMLPAWALMLGSWWGLAGSGALAGGLVYRTLMEERELLRGLAGYAEYAAKVRWRLVPFVW